MSTYENKKNPASQKLTSCVKGQDCAERDNFNAYTELKAQAGNIQTRILEAKKKWYDSAGKVSDGTYNKELELESKIKARETTGEWKIKFDMLYNALKDNFNTVSSLEKYCPKAEVLSQNYTSLTDKTNDKEKETIKQANINHRLASFYDNNDYYEDLLYYFKWVYWVMFLFCIVMLFMSGQYRNVKTYVLIMVLAAFPTLIMQPTITWVNTKINPVKINNMWFSFIILASLVVSLLYYSGNYSIPNDTNPTTPPSNTANK